MKGVRTGWWVEFSFKKKHTHTHTLSETNSLPLKIEAPWKRRFLLETTIFRGELLVLGSVSPWKEVVFKKDDLEGI